MKNPQIVSGFSTECRLAIVVGEGDLAVIADVQHIGAGNTSTLNYHTGGSTTFVIDGFSITDPTAGVQPVNYSDFATVEAKI